MNNIVIENKELYVEISQKGAELQSVKKGNKECLWGGDPTVWSGRAPLLFPVCGSLKEDKFLYKNREYKMKAHGFAANSVFEVEKALEDCVTFLLTSDDDTKKSFPFDFELRAAFKLDGNTLEVEYSVINKGKENMYFSIGSHEAYLCEGGIENYSLVFENREEFENMLLNGKFLNGKSMKLSESSYELPLKYEYFKMDTLIFRDIKSKKVTLKKNKNEENTIVSYSDFDNLLIWTMDGAEFICIEPWNGLPDYDDQNFDIEKKVGIKSLMPGENYVCRHVISF